MTALAALPLTRIDIGDEDLSQDPWPALARLREQGPLVWHERYGRWLVTTDRANRRILSDFARFTVRGTTVETLFGSDAFISMDARREHDALRNVWVDAFRPAGVARLVAWIRATVDALLAPLAERLRDGEAVEMSASLCRPLPTLVIGHMMGAPAEVLGDVVRWSDEMAAGAPSYNTPEEVARLRRRGEEAKAALAEYLAGQLEQRRRAPGDDLVSRIVQADVARGMSDEQLVPNLRQLFFAGNETTARWLGQILVAYGENAAVQAELRADRSLIPAANDEVLRWQGVIGTSVRRVCGGPITIEGIELADGAELTCVLASANRDPARYAEPDRFDIHRPRLPALGFGFGFHVCLGQVLAKTVAQVAVEALLDALPAFAVAAPYRYSALPVRGPAPVVLAKA